MSNDFGGTRDRVSAFFNVNLGKISRFISKTAPEDMTGVTKRVNKNGDEVYENILDYIGGNIIKAELKRPKQGQEDFGSEMVFTIENEAGVKCTLSIKFDSAYGRCFMFSVDGVDLSQPVEFEPYQYFNKTRNKDVSGLNLFQGGNKLDWTYGTRENTGGMPQLEQVTFKGKQSWDNTKQLAFLEAKFLELVKKIDEAQAAKAPAPEPTAAPEPATAEDDEVDPNDPF